MKREEKDIKMATANPQQDDLQKFLEMSPIEIAVVRVAGDSSNIWKLQDFRTALVENGVKVFGDPPDLPNFLQKRPEMFYFQNDYIWTKYSSLKGLPDVNSKKSALQSATQMQKFQNPFEKTGKVIVVNTASKQKQRTAEWRQSWKNMLEKDNEDVDDGNPDKNAIFHRVSNARLNPIANILSTSVPDSGNAMRLTTIHNLEQGILFKMPWVFSKLPVHVRQKWKSLHDLDSVLMRDSEFEVYLGCCQLKSILQQNPDPNKVLKSIVMTILSNCSKYIMKNERPAWDPPALPAEMLFSKLPPEMQKYLKNSRGLLGFATLYPSVFFRADSLEIEGKRSLMLKKLSKNYIPGINSNDTSFEETLNNLDPDERRMINPYLTLMKNGLHSKENTKVYVIEGYEKPFFKLKWLWEKLTQQQKRKNNFTTLSSLRNMLIKYPTLFKMIGNHVQRMDHLKKFPCEKGISIAVLQIQSKNSDITYQELYQILRDMFCPHGTTLHSGRIKSVKELYNFFELHENLHSKENEFHQDEDVDMKTNDIQKNMKEITANNEKLQKDVQELQEIISQHFSVDDDSEEKSREIENEDMFSNENENYSTDDETEISSVSDQARHQSLSTTDNNNGTTSPEISDCEIITEKIISQIHLKNLEVQANMSGKKAKAPVSKPLRHGTFYELLKLSSTVITNVYVKYNERGCLASEKASKNGQRGWETNECAKKYSSMITGNYQFSRGNEEPAYISYFTFFELNDSYYKCPCKNECLVATTMKKCFNRCKLRFQGLDIVLQNRYKNEYEENVGNPLTNFIFGDLPTPSISGLKCKNFEDLMERCKNDLIEFNVSSTGNYVCTRILDFYYAANYMYIHGDHEQAYMYYFKFDGLEKVHRQGKINLFGLICNCNENIPAEDMEVQLGKSRIRLEKLEKSLKSLYEMKQKGYLEENEMEKQVDVKKQYTGSNPPSAAEFHQNYYKGATMSENILNGNISECDFDMTKSLKRMKAHIYKLDNMHHDKKLKGDRQAFVTARAEIKSTYETMKQEIEVMIKMSSVSLKKSTEKKLNPNFEKEYFDLVPPEEIHEEDILEI